MSGDLEGNMALVTGASRGLGVHMARRLAQAGAQVATNAYIVEDPVASMQVTDFTALDRFGQPEEIADVVYFLASPLERWGTAQHIEASGGFKL
ncbi:SDR family NAD(P)-dependent oxidoreductase [Novosphingobium malaysiense]|uniref:Short-chain dehydrogenase n=1 Tax=Novosphingobium malaysiense TaxID=1348853 RepID=A0A0B1ZID0_9SPHN|nr:SDR family NAD(P)-dependent oxidoreductase [Novosphingobium malaysiense]KHK90272.1 hypothetical protein LK12_16715 [Novosphingobium malaysiense]